MNSVFEKLRKKDARDYMRRISNGVDRLSIADILPLQQNKEVAPSSNDVDQIAIQLSSVLAQNIDRLMGDSSGLAFFIQFLESCDKLNLIKFWIHVDGFKASLGHEQVSSAQCAEKSLALLDARTIFSRYIDTDSSCSIFLPKKISERVLDTVTTCGIDSGSIAVFHMTHDVRRVSTSRETECTSPQRLVLDGTNCSAMKNSANLYASTAALSDGKVSANLFDEAKNFVHSLFELRFFKDFESSIFYKKYQLQVFSRWCSLDDILYVPALLNSFLEFVDDRHDHDCLQFLIACGTFESNYDSLQDDEAVQDAMSIYDKYFSMQALSPIEIGNSARRAMESEICSDGGRPSRSSFCHAKQLCSIRVYERYLGRFVQSSSYLNFLLELEADIRNAIELPRPNREPRCTGSSSSDSQTVFFDRHFEAKEFKRRPSRSSQHSPLLSRPKRSLNLAEVDCMGQYHVLYDDSLAQDNSTPSRIRQKLRKYLDKSTLREEEIAAEVARTIIADVHSMVEAGRR